MHSEASRTRLAAIAALLVGTTLVHAQQRVPPAPMPKAPPDTIERWLAAVHEHTAGQVDDAAHGVASWPDDHLLFVRAQLVIAINLLNERPFLEIVREEIIRQFQITTEAGGRRLFKLGAILHADIAMLAPDVAPRSRPATRGPGGTAVMVRDGEALGLQGQPLHWSLGRTLINGIQPREVGVAPSRIPTRPVDVFARHWFRATTAFLAHRLMFDEELAHTQLAFGSIGGDPVLLLLAGAMHEQLASTGVQSAIRSASLPDGVTIAVGSERNELNLARQLYERAVTVAGAPAEVHIRLGRVLGRQGDHTGATRALRRGEELAVDPRWKYFAALFLGHEEEQMKRYAAARESYARAATLYPHARSPHLALSRLAAEFGDRDTAAAVNRAMLSLPPDARVDEDPWWSYAVRPRSDFDRWLAEYYGIARAVR